MAAPHPPLPGATAPAHRAPGPAGRRRPRGWTPLFSRDSFPLVQAVMDALPVGVLVTDAGGRMILANAAAGRLLATPLPAIAGRTGPELWPGTPLADLPGRTLAAGARVGPVPCGPAARQDVLAEGAPILGPAGDRQGAICILMPVGGSPGQPVGLETMARLMAGAAHEIRNPLSVLLGITQLLKRHPEQVEQYQPVLESELRRAVSLLEELMYLGSPARLHRQPTRLGELVRTMANGLAASAAAQGVHLALEQYPGDDQAPVDSARVTQVLLNLSQNAFDAMPAGGRLLLVVLPADDHVRVEVHDSGRGMAPQEVAQAFDPFYSTKPGGTGLGLTICRRIMADHGGSIHLQSGPGQGTRVVLCFPRTPGS